MIFYCVKQQSGEESEDSSRGTSRDSHSTMCRSERLADFWLTKVGKPYFAYPAYAIITFELMVLFSAFGAVFGMMFFNRIPRFHHPVFFSEKFSDVSSDAFYVSIEVDDPKYNENNVIDFLKNIGGTEIEVLTDES